MTQQRDGGQVANNLAISPEVVRASQPKLPTQARVEEVNSLDQVEKGTQMMAPAFFRTKGREVCFDNWHTLSSSLRMSRSSVQDSKKTSQASRPSLGHR